VPRSHIPITLSNKKKKCVWHGLTTYSLAVTLLTNVNSQKFYMMLTLSLCVVYGSQNKQWLLPHTTLTEWSYITEEERVYCAVHSSPHIKQTRCIFRGLIKWVWMANDMSVEKCMSRWLYAALHAISLNCFFILWLFNNNVSNTQISKFMTGWSYIGKTKDSKCGQSHK